MSRYDCVIYDFDGVILETVQLKIDAFCQVYQAEDQILVESVRAFAEANGGMSRFEKFCHFETTIFGRDGKRRAIETLCSSYAEIVDLGVSQAKYVKGAPDCFSAVQSFAEQHVVSAAPENDVLGSLRQRGILHYFKSVAGAPKAKIDAFSTILNEGGFDPSRILAIGDSLAEYYAAMELKIPFLAIVNPNLMNRFPSDIKKLPDLSGIRLLFE